jgi:ribosomal-protein-alanine N-acetyltransferase
MLSRRQIRYLLGSPHARVIVAERGDRVVGWTVGLIRQHRASRSGRVYAVAVHPDCQGQGLGRQLFEAVLDALRAHRITRVYLEVRRDNAKARKLYEQFGFTEHAPLPDYYGQRRHGVRMKRLT